MTSEYIICSPWAEVKNDSWPVYSENNITLLHWYVNFQVSCVYCFAFMPHFTMLLGCFKKQQESFTSRITNKLNYYFNFSLNVLLSLWLMTQLREELTIPCFCEQSILMTPFDIVFSPHSDTKFMSHETAKTSFISKITLGFPGSQGETQDLVLHLTEESW